jgi:hypothetical protein
MFASAKIMPNDSEYVLRIQTLQWQLDEAMKVCKMLRRYSQPTAVRRQSRYISRLIYQLDQYRELLGS